MSAPLVLVAAIAQNGVIGAGDRLPWRLPSDLKRFRALTMGKPLLMGRKTFQSIGRALPGRETIIVTRDRDFLPAADSSVHVAHDLDAALALAQARAAAMGADEIILAGGGALYQLLLDRVQRMYLTFVDLTPEGDVSFPPIDWSQWVEQKRIAPQPQANDEASFAFVEFRRQDKASS
ncbi:MAG: dihydrofolate reductase [Methylocella sp.]